MLNYTPTPDLLTNRVILVTGASRGIGRAAAKAFALHGATVILLARTIPDLESLYDEIEKNNAPTPAIYPLNLANATPQDYDTLKIDIEKQFGKLDGILHNASMLGSLTTIELTPFEQWYHVLQVNLNAPFILTSVLLPLLKKSEDASIIFTSADIGKKARAYWGSYAVSKFGCEALMEILSAELETNTNIRVNSINPGKIKTKLRKEAYPFEDPKSLRTPEDILPYYLYLMGLESKGITGKGF